MQYRNAILKMIHTNVKNLRRSNAIDSLQTNAIDSLQTNAIDSLQTNVHFEANTYITSRSTKRTRDHIEIYIEKKQKKTKKLGMKSKVYILGA
jgi:hypothetical protein